MKLSEVLQQIDEKASMAQLYKLYSQAMKAVPGSKKHKELQKQISKLRKELNLNEVKGELGKR